MFYKLGAAGRALRKIGAIDFATTIAPGLRDVLLTGKVKEATTRTAGRPPGLRRGGARRAADRPDRPLPQRDRGDRPAGQGGPDQDPERGRRRAAALADDRGARGDAAGGDAGPGDGRRDRRAAPAWASRSAGSSSTAPGRRCWPAGKVTTGRAQARAGRGRPAGRPGHRGRAGRRGEGAPDPARAGGVAAGRAGRAGPADGGAAAAARRGGPGRASTTLAGPARRRADPHTSAPRRRTHDADTLDWCRRTTAPRLDVDALLADPGSGSSSAAAPAASARPPPPPRSALRAAEQHGRRTVVLTIDPARRLAQSLGLTELDNTPRQVKGIDAEAAAASCTP